MQNSPIWIVVGLVAAFVLFSERPEPVTPWRPIVPPLATPPSQPTQPQVLWIDYPALREISNLGKVLSDIESHMPAGHEYRSSDKITWAHETTHGINSELRRKFQKGLVTSWDGQRYDEVFFADRINGFYCLEDRAVVITEPNTTIAAAADLVPQSLQGVGYDLYMIQQRADWNDTPLYILDEWVAYTNGAACARDLNLDGNSEVDRMVAFNVYAMAVAMAAKQDDPTYDDGQLKAFLMWSIERSFLLLRNETSATDYIKGLQTASDAEALRAFAREYFGKTWTQKTLGF